MEHAVSTVMEAGFWHSSDLNQLKPIIGSAKSQVMASMVHGRFGDADAMGETIRLE